MLDKRRDRIDTNNNLSSRNAGSLHPLDCPCPLYSNLFLPFHLELIFLETFFHFSPPLLPSPNWFDFLLPKLCLLLRMHVFIPQPPTHHALGCMEKTNHGNKNLINPLTRTLTALLRGFEPWPPVISKVYSSRRSSYIQWMYILSPNSWGHQWLAFKHHLLEKFLKGESDPG